MAGHGVQRIYSLTKNTPEAASVVRLARRRRGQHRHKRVRRPMVSMMLHQDGSRLDSVPGAAWDLIVTMDAADSTIYTAIFVLVEGTMSSSRARVPGDPEARAVRLALRR